MARSATLPHPASPAPQRRWWNRWAIGLFIAIIIGAAAASIASAFRARQHTGTVIIQPGSNQARISLGQAGSDTRIVGTGPMTIRVRPGTYQLTASDQHSAVSKRVTVAEHAITTLRLSGGQPVPVQKIAHYHAQYLYAKDDTLYFLNQADGIPYAYKLGSDAGRPQMASLNSVRSMHWLGPTEVVAENNSGSWMHIKDEQKMPLSFDKDQPTPGSASFSSDGAWAFVASTKKIMAATGMDGPPEPIGETTQPTTKVSMGPNHSMLVYTPRTTDHDPTEPTRLYQQGRLTALDSTMTGIANVAWNTDGSAFSYTTPQGSFIYTLATKQTQQVLAGLPTHPSSMLWLSPQTLIYADSGTIWQYDPAQDISTRLASMEGTLNADGRLYMTDDKQFVYFSTATGASNKTGAIYRFMPNYPHMSKDERLAAVSQQAADSQHPKTYLGTDKLVQVGLTPDQVQAAKYALGQFEGTNKPAVNVITIKDVHTKLRRGQNYEVYCKLLSGPTSYDAQLNVTNISAIELLVFDEKDHHQLFDSGPIRTQ